MTFRSTKQRSLKKLMKTKEKCAKFVRKFKKLTKFFRNIET